MRIVYFISSLSNSGGLERVTTTKANGLSELPDYEVFLITLRRDDNKPFFELNRNVRLFTVNDFSKHSIAAALAEIKPDISISIGGEEKRYLPELPDAGKTILEFHFSRYYLSHLVAGIRKLRWRKLHFIKASWIQHKERLYAEKFDKVVLLTEKDKELRGIRNNMSTIPNPLSFRCKEGERSMQSNRRILACGRLIAQKGFDILVDVFAGIEKNHPGWSLHIFGKGQDKDLLSDMIAAYGLQDKIIIHAPTLNIREEMLKSDIFAFPSRYEGFGLVLTEAMECGLPCVSFDCECGPSEIISDGDDGYIVPMGDSIKFGHALATLMSDEKLRKRMGERAKENVKRFYTDNIIHKWDELFREMV